MIVAIHETISERVENRVETDIWWDIMLYVAQPVRSAVQEHTFLTDADERCQELFQAIEGQIEEGAKGKK